MRDLSKMVNTNDVLREVAYQNSHFNLFDFFDKSSDDSDEFSEYEDACGFITRSQAFYCKSKIHALVFENVGGSLYDDGSTVRNAYYAVFSDYYHAFDSEDKYTNDAWRYANADLGMISIQLVYKSFAIFWLPDKINSFQKQKILEFCDEIKRINHYLNENGYSEIIVSFCPKRDNDFYGDMDMDSFISQIDSYVDDNCYTPYERNLSDYIVDRQI